MSDERIEYGREFQLLGHGKSNNQNTDECDELVRGLKRKIITLINTNTNTKTTTTVTTMTTTMTTITTSIIYNNYNNNNYICILPSVKRCH